VISPSLLALATLGGATLIGSFLLDKASMEGNIADIIAVTIRGIMVQNFAYGNTAL
jgi:hypothetical protein